MLSTDPAHPVTAGEFLQACSFRAIELALDQPWGAVRLAGGPSPADHEDVDVALEAGSLELGQPISKWVEQLSTTLAAAVHDALALWTAIAPPPGQRGANENP